jgi:hypothetical protein
MTTSELKNEFLISYNSIASNSAPNLDDFEISTYLTKAQLELVKDYYDPQSNKKQKGFEASEKRRSDLEHLLIHGDSSIILNTSTGIDKDSKMFVIPNEVFLITTGYVKTSTDNSKCISNTDVDVIPITHDEYLLQKRNPYKKPNNKTAWRLTLSRQFNQRVVEIISPYKLSKYIFRYIKYPKPIIITDLNIAFPNDSLTIDGISVKTECELNNSVHREIIDRAVELALKDYRPENLERHVQINLRNE